ncbi:MAG: DNA repair protein RecN [Fibrobacterota bacterium]
MLTSLQVKNLALIENISIELFGGFSVFTGETGAGKSILMGAIDLLLGGRASASSVRSGEEKAEVSGVFVFSSLSPGLKEFLAENDIECADEELIIRRIIRKNGRNRVLLNAVEVPLSVLRGLGRLLFDLHGQHDHQALLSESAAGEIIDSFSEVAPAKKEYQKCWHEYRRAEDALKEHQRRIETLRERGDFVQFQYNEIDELSLKEGELEELGQEYRRISSVNERSQAAAQIDSALSDEGECPGIATLATTLSRGLATLAEFDPAFTAWVTSVGETQAVFNDLQNTISSYVHDIQEEYDPHRMDEINSRISRIQRLMKKHACDYAGLLEKHRVLQEELSDIENSRSDATQLKKQMDAAYEKLMVHGEKLHGVRQKISRIFDKKITEKMDSLGFTGGGFYTEFTTCDTPREEGISVPRFMVRTNRGEPFMPLASTASGGEISRIMLAVKCILAENDPVPVLVFDEIDTGVGGVLAASIAREMRSLARFHQLFVITHLQQIAARADTQYSVYKAEKDGRIITKIERLSGDKRVDEIARMLGDDSSQHSREMARKLLNDQM